MPLRFTFLIVIASFVVFPAKAPAASLRAGDVFEIVRTYQTQQLSTDGSRGTSRGSDTVVVKIISIDGDGMVFELDHPTSVNDEARQRDWTLPARVVRPNIGPARLLNAVELSARLDEWLARGNRTREDCGHWLFTWSAFRIACDPAIVAATLEDGFPPDPIAGRAYSHPLAARTAPIKRQTDSNGRKFLIADLAVDAARVREMRARQEEMAREIAGPFADEAPDPMIENESISGNISMRFEILPDGSRWRRSEAILIVTTTPDGAMRTSAEFRTLDRYRILRADSEN